MTLSPPVDHTLYFGRSAFGGWRACASVSKTNILIGKSSPFSGSNKELGDDIREGIQAYFKQANNAGGDQRAHPRTRGAGRCERCKRAGENARILIEQRGVLALLGYASATLSLPALPLSREQDRIRRAVYRRRTDARISPERNTFARATPTSSRRSWISIPRPA